jgi:hypothetical protein
MGRPNEDFEIESTMDFDDIDTAAAEKLLARANKPPEIEVVQEERELPIKKEAAELSDEPSEEELAAYSESVQKRIKKLTFDREEARRQQLQAQQERDEAVQYAQRALEQRKQFEDQSRKYGEQSLSALVEKLDTDLKSARSALIEAMDRYDTEAAADAQMRIADLTSQKREAEARKNARPVAQQERDVVQQQPSTRPAPDARAQEWVARNNAWFQKDKAMTAFVFGVHEDLVEKGVDPRAQADAYYKALDQAVRKRFPEQFEDSPSTNTPRTSPVAPATRSVNGRKRVTLSQTELNLARRLGVTPEQFASEKIKLENRNG